MTVLSQLALIEAPLFLALGFQVLRSSPGARANRLFLLVALAFTLWLVGFAYAVSAPTVEAVWPWYRLSAVGWTVGPVVLWHFFGELTRARVVRKRPAVVLGGYALAALLWGRHLTDRPFATDFVRTPLGWDEVIVSASPWTLLTVVHAFGFALVGLYWVWRWGWSGSTRRARLQATVVLVTGIPVLLAVTLLNVALRALRIHAMPGLAPLVLPIWGAGVAYAVARYRMLTLSPAIAAERILRTMTDAVVLLSPRDHILAANPAACGLLDVPEAELVGRSLRDFLPDEPSTKMRRQVAGGAVYQSEVRYRPAGRKPIDLTVTASLVLDDTDDLVGTVMILRDVSARKEMTRALEEREQHFRSLIENASDLIFIADATGRCRYASPSVERVLGQMAPELVGESFRAHVHPDDAAAFAAQVLALAGNDATRVRIELRCRHRDGTWRILEVVASPLREGSQRDILLNARDVTERKQFEQQLAQAERERVDAQLAQANRLASVGMLAASVAHEMNNPLTYVIGNLELLEEELGSATARTSGAEGKPCAPGATDPTGRHAAAVRPGAPEMLARAELGDCAAAALRGARRIERIVRELRRFSRAGSAEVGSVRLDEVVEAALDIASTQLRHRAHVVRDVAPLPPVVGNEGKLGQVVLNLLVNAAQAIPEGQHDSNTVTVRAWARSEEVVLEVEDTGRGIAPEHLERIFEPFFTTKSEAEGSGLGLWIVRNILKAWGGVIEVRSEVGHGTTVTVRLPTAEAAARASEAPEPPARPVPLVSGIPGQPTGRETAPPISHEAPSASVDGDDDEAAG